MTTAQVLFAQYQVLPPHIQQQFKKLVMNDAQQKVEPVVNDKDDEDSGDTIRISLSALHTSIEQVKLLRAGKLKTQPAHQMLAEVRAELAAEQAKKNRRTAKKQAA